MSTKEFSHYRVALKIRVPRSERPRWLVEGLAMKHRDFFAAEQFVQRIAEWSGKTQVASITAVVRRTTVVRPVSAYDDGHSVGSMMREARADDDFSYDCRWDLADAAKRPGDYFNEFKRGLEAGLDAS